MGQDLGGDTQFRNNEKVFQDVYSGLGWSRGAAGQTYGMQSNRRTIDAVRTYYVQLARQLFV